ncbi:hypothetical protein BJY01DRAFT_216253 [Aspergillus pseudoustus]|uniref:F-box domain-containing protein n=1 Tax=Aspergillus pseudoustus TaxID=1810923 RepID=A0ABR4JSA7_9EURO
MEAASGETLTSSLDLAKNNWASITMGYSEAYCHLCGVSFNIARHRKPGEPELATYSSTDGMAAEFEDIELEECIKTGCTLVVKDSYKEENDLINDPDYEPADDDDVDDEPYEYDSQYDSGDEMSVSGDEDDSDGATDDENDTYIEFLARSVRNQPRTPGEPVGAFAFSPNTKQHDTLIPITSDEIPEGYEPDQLEHIPSSTCRQAQAYAGANISMIEMRGCRTAQFLVHKSSTKKGKWKPDGFNEDWELKEDWFLSGIADGMESRDCGYPTVWPARGGVAVVQTDNINFDPRYTSGTDLAMPFHPWCFDIFSRQSKAQFGGKVNVSGLMQWRDAESSYEQFHAFPRIADVLEAREQWWDHMPDREYLAANPLYVPGLPALLRSAASGDGLIGYKSSSATTSPDRGEDRLGSLPMDLRLYIISFLDSNDISSLRAASRAFTQLPNSVWYKLVRKEMPWLWEAWDEREVEHTPSFWTTITANEIKYIDEIRKSYGKILKQDHKGDEGILDYLFPRSDGVPEQMKLPRASTNWHAVFTAIKGNWDKLKGLRNRQRIWEDVEEVISRIRKYEEVTTDG